MPLVRDVILRDGSVLRLREPGPEDRDAVRVFFERLDPDSLYLRFHGHPRIDRVVEHYATADGVNRVALLAHRGGDIVAIAEYERLREPGAAEVAFAVLASEQGRGLGTRMLEQLAAHAAANGLDRFDASVIASNRRMLGVFAGAGFAVRRQGYGGEVELSLDIRPTERLAKRIAERDHVATVASLRPLLAPASVAVVGASNAPGSVGGTIFSNLLASGFAGVATPVNRAAGVVHSVRAFARVSEMPEPPELVVVAVPAAEVLDVAADAAGAGVRALVVVSAGFAERDAAGVALQDRLLAIARDRGVRMIGPNSLGVLNTDPGVALNASLGRLRPAPGRLAISSQSGALGIGLLGQAVGRGLGVAAFVSLGNRADVSTNDLLELWEDDERVDVIALYMESFGNPRRFSALSRRVSRHKPVIAVKGRRGGGGFKGAGSHTARALRGEAVFDALFRQAGVLRVEGTQQLFDAAALLEAQPLIGGRGVAVVTNSGGLGTMAADALEGRGLTLAAPAEATQRALEAALPGADRTTNPVDLGISAQPADLTVAVETLLGDGAVDAAIVLSVDLAGVPPADMLAAVEGAAAGAGKPVVASVVGADGRAPVRPGAVPNLRFPEACAGVLALAADRRDWLSRPLGQRPALEGVDPEAARRVVGGQGAGWLDRRRTETVLRHYGIVVLESVVCDTVDATVAAAAQLGGPVVLKAELELPEHAGDVDAVLIGLEGSDALRAGWEALRDRVERAGRAWAGAVVQPLADPGADVLVGAVNHRELGVVAGAGAGGRQAGLGIDVAFRLAPATDVDAFELLAAAPFVAAVLDGRRGQAPLDRPALAGLVLRLARLFEDLPVLAEGDLNPVRVLPDGLQVLDARLRVQAPPVQERLKTW